MSTAVAGASRLKAVKRYLPKQNVWGRSVSRTYVFLVVEPPPSTTWATLAVLGDSEDQALTTACLAAGQEGYSDKAQCTFLGYEA